MFEVDVKNVTEGRRGGEGRRGPARVWGSDTNFYLTALPIVLSHCALVGKTGDIRY